MHNKYNSTFLSLKKDTRHVKKIMTDGQCENKGHKIEKTQRLNFM
jgi:hypothetical protein